MTDNEEALIVVAEARMRKLSRAQMPAWKVRQLKIVQEGRCAICGKEVDLTIEREGVVDHNHDTGEIRGVLHRSCNAAEGKIANAAGAWGAKSMKYPDIISFLRNLLAYYDKPGCGMTYPGHKSAEETATLRKNKTNIAARERRAKIKAAKAMRDQRD